MDRDAQFDYEFLFKNLATLPYLCAFQKLEVVNFYKNQAVHIVHVMCENVLKLCIKYILNFIHFKRWALLMLLPTLLTESPTY